MSLFAWPILLSWPGKKNATACQEEPRAATDSPTRPKFRRRGPLRACSTQHLARGPQHSAPRNVTCCLANSALVARQKKCNRLPRGAQRSYRLADPAKVPPQGPSKRPVSYTHLRAHETVLDLVCSLLLAKKN